MIPRSHLYGCALFLLCAAVFPAFAGEEEPAAPLRKGDAILVDIGSLGGGLPAYREIIDSQGNIELPFLGLIPAGGKTPATLEAEMAEAYATARLSTNAIVHITFITHFEPPPARENLVRVQDPRRPVSAPGGSAPLNPEP
jgi:protein involved in polysaccharide export with SLBB domain